MAFRPYASRPARLTVQVVADLFAVAWTAGWVWAAVQVHDIVTDLASAGFRLRDGAGGVASSLRDAGGRAAKIPLAGDALAAPLRSAGGAAGDVASSGQQLGDGVTAAALPLALALLAAAVLPVVVPWLIARWRFARRAGAAAGLARTPAGTRLLAFRALANAPAHRITAVAPDAVDGWFREDTAVVEALAALELRRNGLFAGRALRVRA